MTASIAAPAGSEDDDGILGHCGCACGRAATIILKADDEGPWCTIRCDCGAFSPAEPDGDAS